MYGGYVLHTCVLPEDASWSTLQSLRSEMSAVAAVDYTRRRRTAPNHTMTHVLNFALREVRQHCTSLGALYIT